MAFLHDGISARFALGRAHYFRTYHDFSLNKRRPKHVCAAQNGVSSTSPNSWKFMLIWTTRAWSFTASSKLTNSFEENRSKREPYPRRQAEIVNGCQARKKNEQSNAVQRGAPLKYKAHRSTFVRASKISSLAVQTKNVAIVATERSKTKVCFCLQNHHGDKVQPE